MIRASPRSADCTSPAASSCRTRGTSAARVVLEQLGFSALATTSAGSPGRSAVATTARPSTKRSRTIAAVAAAVKVPVNADFERAFATGPDEVAANVVASVRDGNRRSLVEDSTHDADDPLFDFGSR
jgi:methylisocitrate lyase